MRSFKNILIGLGIVVALGITASAQNNPCNPCGGKAMKSHAMGDGTMFHINDPMNRNSITFKSQAPLEDIVGTSNLVTGMISFDVSNPKAGGHGKVMIPVSSLNTGIPLRNEHLTGADWLNADKNPNIVFEIKELKNVKSVKKGSGSETFKANAIGEFSLNGKSKKITVPVTFTYLKESKTTKTKMAGDLLAIRAKFEVSLADYGITGPKGKGLIGSKVGETVAIELSLMATNAGGEMAGNPCNPCGGKAMNPCNPCGGKAMNPCNPCGGKAKNPCNPCGGKAKNPCNPCGGKSL